MRISDWSSDVCSSDLAVRRKFLSGEHYYELYTVTHLAAPESGWRGPVGHYRLVVDKRATANFVAFCPLAARKISPTTFEWTAADFTPGSQTGVLFFVNTRSEEHTSELQSLMRISYAVSCLKKK